MHSKKIVIYGITGSIGDSAVKVVEAFPEKFTIVGCSAGKNVKKLNTLLSKFHTIRKVTLCSDKQIDILPAHHNVDVKYGHEYLNDLLDLKPDMVVMALPGKAGWKITIECIKRNIPVALANKESLVIAGFMLGKEITSDRNKIIPVDSEHAALMQLLENCNRDTMTKAYITASGGAFINMSKEEMFHATADEALNHPVWQMGKKVTVDSATLLNKGLELIEAYWLFDIAPEKLDVIVHPEVDVHAVIEFIDGSYLAQIAVSDMVVPIAAALSYPEMINLKNTNLGADIDIQNRNLQFRPPDFDKYPLLECAFDLLKREDYAGMVAYAISDETAVEYFLYGKISVKTLFDTVLKTVAAFSGRNRPQTITELQTFIEEIENYTKNLVEET